MEPITLGLLVVFIGDFFFICFSSHSHLTIFYIYVFSKCRLVWESNSRPVDEVLLKTKDTSVEKQLIAPYRLTFSTFSFVVRRCICFIEVWALTSHAFDVFKQFIFVIISKRRRAVIKSMWGTRSPWALSQHHIPYSILSFLVLTNVSNSYR